MGPSKGMDRIRRVVDWVMIFASLLMLTWPAYFGSGRFGVLPPVGVVLGLGLGVVFLSARWPLLQYGPTAAAVIMAGYWHYRDGHVSPGLTWLLIATSAIILVRQFLGARTNEGLVRDLNRERAILARQASRDPLTELGNRKMFMDHATDALADADDTMTAVILIDLDGFNGVNDTYGHAAGDALLRTAAERLNANVRSNDTVSRLSGDEFVVLLPRLTDDQIADT